MQDVSFSLGIKYGLSYFLLALGYHQNQPPPLFLFKKKLERNFNWQVDVTKLLIRTQFKRVTFVCAEQFPYSEICMRKSRLRC